MRPDRGPGQGRPLERALPGRQGRLLFAYLVANRDRACPRVELIDALWPEDPPAAADSALSALLSKLRRALGAGVLRGRSDLRFDSARRWRSTWRRRRRRWRGPRRRSSAGAGRSRRPRACGARRRSADASCPTAAACGWPSAATSTRRAAARAGGARRAGRRPRRRRPGRGRAGGEGGDRRGAVPRVRPPGADGGARGGRQPGRGAARVRAAAGAAARRARNVAGRRPRWPSTSGCCAASPPPAAAAAPPTPSVTWPGPLAAAVERHPFVDRATELAFLEDCWAQALGGARQLVLLAGDAGIGKTRAAAEFSRRAHAAGALVLYGRFDEQTRRRTSRWSRWSAAGPTGRRSSRCASGSARAPPSSGSCCPSSGAARPASTARRRRPPAAVLRRGRGAARRGGGRPRRRAAVRRPPVGGPADAPAAPPPRPLAAAAPRAVPRHLPRRRAPAASIRCTSWSATCAGRARSSGSSSRGLGEGEVGELVAALGVRSPAPGFVSALHGETEGNPFFIEEVVGHLREEGDRLGAAVTLAQAGVPDGVREVTSRRLRRLGDDARQAVVVAAVVGREFDFELLERSCVRCRATRWWRRSRRPSRRASSARRAGSGATRSPTRWCARRSTTASPSCGGRACTRGWARRWPPSAAPDVDAELPQLAHHFAMAAPVDRPERAVDYALAAARRADRLMAWDDAAAHYREALRARELSGAADDRVRGDLLLELGTSEERAGDEEGSRRSFRAAAETARGLGDAGAARPRGARLSPGRGRCSAGSTSGASRRSTRRWRRSGPRRRRCGRGCWRGWGSSSTTRATRSGGSRSPARRSTSRGGSARTGRWRPPGRAPLRAVATGDGRRAAGGGGRAARAWRSAPTIRSWSSRAPGWTVVDLLEIGDVQGADIQIAAASKLAEALHRPLYLWWTSGFRCARAQLAGDFELAERLAQETLAIGQRGQAENAMHYYAQAIFNIRREQGRLAEIEDAVRRFIELYPAIPAWRAGLALLLVELGRPDEARSELDVLAADGLDAFPRDANWLIGITLMAEVCGALGDARRAEALYERAARRTRGATSSWAARRPATAPRRACSGCWRRRCGAGTRPTRTSATRWRCTSGWARARGGPGRSSPGRRCCSPAAPAATRPAPASCSPTPCSRPTRSGCPCSPTAPARSCRPAARPTTARLVGGESSGSAAYRPCVHGPLHHRLRLLRVRRRGAPLARAVPGVRGVEHAGRGGPGAAAAPARGRAAEAAARRRGRSSRCRCRAVQGGAARAAADRRSASWTACWAAGSCPARWC